VNGICTCAPGFAECSGTCVRTNGEPIDCILCRGACSGATPVCQDRTCVPACDEDSTLCDGVCRAASYFETDDLNCGACNVSCTFPLSCIDSVCDCPAGLTSCNVNANTLCIDITGDSSNCGGCGIACATGAMCQNRKCVGGNPGVGGSSG
jgi:hypothetical protein